MGKAGSVAMSMANSLPPLAVFSAISLPVPMFAAFALLDNAAPGLWDFFTAFGAVAAPVGIGLAIAAHVLGKKLGTLVGRMDRVMLSREVYTTRHELPSLTSLLNGAVKKVSQAHASLTLEKTQIDTDAILLILPQLHAIRSAIISTRLTKINNIEPLQEIDYLINAIALGNVGRDDLLKFKATLKEIRTAARVRMELPERR